MKLLSKNTQYKHIMFSFYFILWGHGCSTAYVMWHSLWVLGLAFNLTLDGNYVQFVYKVASDLLMESLIELWRIFFLHLLWFFPYNAILVVFISDFVSFLLVALSLSFIFRHDCSVSSFVFWIQYIFLWGILIPQSITPHTLMFCSMSVYQSSCNLNFERTLFCA